MEELLTWLDNDVDGGAAIANHDQLAYEIVNVDKIYDELLEHFDDVKRGGGEGFVEVADTVGGFVEDDDEPVAGGGFVEIEGLIEEENSVDFQSWLKEIIRPLLYDGIINTKTNTGGNTDTGGGKM